MQRTIMELLWLFILYSFVGWILETIAISLRRKRFVNRGFLNGPFCIVYGFSAVIMEIFTYELRNQWIFLFIGCGLIATACEWFAGKILERMTHKKWWDYSNIPWNYNGYICLPYSVFWAFLGYIGVLHVSGFFLSVYHVLPDFFAFIIVLVCSFIVICDLLLSTAILWRRQKQSKQAVRFQKNLSAFTQSFGISIVNYVENRMVKAYPLITEKAYAASKKGVFAEGCGFYKLFWLFVIGALLGDFTETIFCRIVAGEWMSRSSLVWGPFSIVWGLAIGMATALLYKDCDKPDRHIFLIGTFLGGAYEYICSVFTEIVFGKVFWDYSHIPFNLGGRVNLLYCFFWGIAAVVWIKLLYPKFSDWIEKIPVVMGYILTWLLVAFMVSNLAVSSLALIRYEERANGKKADNFIEQIIDERFDDQRMEQIYPNAISTTK